MKNRQDNRRVPSQRKTTPKRICINKGGDVVGMKRLGKMLLFGALLLGSLILFAGCGESPPESGKTPAKSDKIASEEERLTFAFDGWSGTYLPMYVLKAVFEDELGYRVEVADLQTIPAAFEAVASGRADIFTSAWFPARDSTLDKYPNLVKLGLLYGGKAKDAYEGWMVSADLAKRFNLTHVKDLRNRKVAKALDVDGDGKGNLIGSPPTWASAKRHPEILGDYGLAGLYEIDKVGSEKELLTHIDERFRQGKPALFYMCDPVAFPGDVPMTERAKWLKGIEAYLPLAFNRTVVRNDLIANHPEVAKILCKCKIPGADVGRAMRQIAKKGKSPKFLIRLAREWIDSHRAEVDSWLEGICERSPAPTHEALTLAYSPEKEELMQRLAIEFNLSRPQEIPAIQPIRLHMASMLEDAMDGGLAAISPDSSIWLVQLDRRWQKKNPGASPLVGHRVRYALSPIVIAMWEKKAAKMGYPGKALGWQDLMNNASTDPDFKWCHPSATTASGLLATTAEFYAGAGKQANLTKEDLQAEGVLEYVKSIEATVERYGGESEDRVVIRMLAEGGYPLDAFVAQEQLVIFFNCNTEGEKLVAIYPKEGTFWMDHPLVLLDGPWVTEEQKRAFREFAAFVAKPEQQRLVLMEGYRPAEVGFSLQAEGSLVRPEYNVDPNQPKTLLKVPSAGVVGSIRELWRLTKKPANIYLVVDVSGSMRGEKLSGAKGALFSFIDQIEGERDKVALVDFSDNVREIQRLGKLDRERFGASIRGLKAEGGTRLYTAVAYAFEKLEKQGEPQRINVIVAMTDGKSNDDIAILESKLRATDFPVLIFTVAYGEDADLDALQRIAQLSEGRAYPSDPETIETLYQLLSAYF